MLGIPTQAPPAQASGNECLGAARATDAARLLLLLPIALLALHVWSSSALADPCIARAAKLSGSGAVGAAGAGYCASLSADGATAVVGAEYDENSVGAAFVFVRSGTDWTQQGPKLVPNGGVGQGRFGISVAISSDASTILVGAIEDDGDTGAAYVFVRSGASWVQQGPKLVPTGAEGPGMFGRSVALSADGSTALIGANYDHASRGSAYVFARSGGAWTQQGPKLVPTGGVGTEQFFGYSTALSADGNTALVGAVWDAFTVGAAYVFVRSGPNWSQQGAKLVPTGSVGVGQAGFAVALSANGNTALVGANTDDGGIGAAYGFVRTGTTWAQQGPKIVPTGGAGDGEFGVSVSLSADGNRAAVGAWADDNYRGAAYLFSWSGTAWTPLGAKIAVPDAVGSIVDLGTSVSLRADGAMALVGAWQDDFGVGSAYIFGIDPEAFISQQPVGVSVASGGGATFTIGAASDVPVTYQWRRNGLNQVNGVTASGMIVTGATTPALHLSAVSLADNAAAFDCVVSNACGSVRSDPAGLGVLTNCPEDIFRDGFINTVDLAALLARFGQHCQ